LFNYNNNNNNFSLSVEAVVVLVVLLMRRASGVNGRAKRGVGARGLGFVYFYVNYLLV
jgi:hypothetical protein